MSSNTHSPCAACKCLRRKCTQECVFAPYFPPDCPNKFQNVHKVYGASNVAKILNELNVAHREDAVTSLAFEAEARLRDPVYGCVGSISILQERLKHLQAELYHAKKDLSAYIGPQALMIPVFHPSPQQQQTEMNGTIPVPMFGVPTDPQQHNGLSVAGQLVNHQQQQHMFDFNVNNGIENGNGFINQMGNGNGRDSNNGFGINSGFGHNHMQGAEVTNNHQHNLDYHLQAQLMLQSQSKSEGEES